MEVRGSFRADKTSLTATKALTQAWRETLARVTAERQLSETDKPALGVTPSAPPSIPPSVRLVPAVLPPVSPSATRISRINEPL